MRPVAVAHTQRTKVYTKGWWQMTEKEKCPIHGTPLRNTCADCEKDEIKKQVKQKARQARSDAWFEIRWGVASGLGVIVLALFVGWVINLLAR